MKRMMERSCSSTAARALSCLANLVAYFMIVLTLCVAASPTYVQAVHTATVSGRVVDEYGQGMRNVEIKVYTSDGDYVESTSTSSGGSFAIKLEVGKGHDLHFSKEGYAKATKSVRSLLISETANLGDIVLLKALRLSSSVLSRVASPGDKLTLSFAASNIGEELEVAEFSVTKPDGWSTRILDEIGEVTKVYLPSGVSMSLQLEVAIPLTSSGNYNLSLSAVGKTSSTLNFTMIVETSSKPVISCQFPGKSVAPGETVRFQVGLQNPFSAKLRFGVAVDSVPQGWMAFVKSAGAEAVTEVTLEGNELVDLMVDVYVPREEADGSYDVVFRASSSAVSESITLVAIVEKIAAGMGVNLQAVPPYLDAYAGSRAKFSLELANGGGYEQLFDLKIMGLPQDLRAWFEGSDGGEITRIYVEAGESEEFNVVVAIPRGTALGALDFMVSAASLSVTRSVGLTLNVLGLYEIKLMSQNLFVSLTVGEEASYGLRVRNTGTEVVTNLDVTTTSSIPEGFTVDVEPAVLPSLRPDDEAVFTVSVTTQSDVNAGNYYVDFEVQSDQAESIAFSLQIGVEQQMSWIYIGGGLVMVAIVALFLVYRRFGRR